MLDINVWQIYSLRLLIVIELIVQVSK